MLTPIHMRTHYHHQTHAVFEGIILHDTPDPLNPEEMVTGRVQSLVDRETGALGKMEVFNHNAPIVRAFIDTSPEYGGNTDPEIANKYRKLAKCISPYSLSQWFKFRMVLDDGDDGGGGEEEGAAAAAVEGGKKKYKEYKEEEVIDRKTGTFKSGGEAKTYRVAVVGGTLFRLGKRWMVKVKTGTGQGDKVCVR